MILTSDELVKMTLDRNRAFFCKLRLQFTTVCHFFDGRSDAEFNFILDETVDEPVLLMQVGERYKELTFAHVCGITWSDICCWCVEHNVLPIGCDITCRLEKLVGLSYDDTCTGHNLLPDFLWSHSVVADFYMTRDDDTQTSCFGVTF